MGKAYPSGKYNGLLYLTFCYEQTFIQMNKDDLADISFSRLISMGPPGKNFTCFCKSKASVFL